MIAGADETKLGTPVVDGPHGNGQSKAKEMGRDGCVVCGIGGSSRGRGIKERHPFSESVSVVFLWKALQ